MIVLVPDYIERMINDAIDKALDGRPIDPEERKVVYSVILNHFDHHGTIPEFQLNANN